MLSINDNDLSAFFITLEQTDSQKPGEPFNTVDSWKLFSSPVVKLLS